MWIFTKKDINTGQFGESLAVQYLQRKQYKILATNWYNSIGKRLGEIDIIAQKKDGTIVFVEVKTRVIGSQDQCVLPEEQITVAKIRKLQRIAECYIKEHALWDRSWQFDAVSVLIKDEKLYDLRHLENIFF